MSILSASVIRTVFNINVFYKQTIIQSDDQTGVTPAIKCVKPGCKNFNFKFNTENEMSMCSVKYKMSMYKTHHC